MRALLLSLLLLQTAPTYLETLEVSITNLDVIVTDRDGHRVTGLTKNDFEVSEDGAPQPITHFAEYLGSSGAAVLRGTEEPAVVAAPPARRFIFFVDQLSLHPNARRALIDSAADFIRREMRDDDEAMVVTTTIGEKLELDFSRDKNAVLARLTKVLDENAHFRADTDLERELFTLRHGNDIVARRNYATMVNRRVTSGLRTMLGIVGAVDQLPGRKILVAITRSMSAQPGREVWSIVEPDAAPIPDEFSSRNVFAEVPSDRYWFDARPMIAALAARASANGVTIYAIQPDLGFHINAPGGAESSGRAAMTASRQPVVTLMQRTMLSDTQETLTTLADATGGKYALGDQNIGSMFREIAQDVTSYYSIAYRAPSGSNDAIRKIDVRVRNRPDLTVRTRRELLRVSPQREMDEIVTASLLAPRNVNELGITAAASHVERHHDTSAIDVAVTIPMEKLTFVAGADGKYEAQFSVHYAAADGHDYTTGESREETVRIPAADIDTARTKSYTYTSTLIVARGTAKIAVGVFDKLSRLSGFQRLSVVAR